MVKIQIDLTEKEDRIVEVYKLVHGMKSKEDAIKNMIHHFKVKIVPEKLEGDEEYYKKALQFSEETK